MSVSTPRRRAAGDIRVARTVLDEIKGLEPPEADAVRETIDSIGATEGEPVDIPVAPPGTAYLALAPADQAAPVVIYRPMLPDENGDWLVTALMDRDDYEVQQEAQRHGLLRDPAVRTAVTAAATAISDAVNGRRRLRDRRTDPPAVLVIMRRKGPFGRVAEQSGDWNLSKSWPLLEFESMTNIFLSTAPFWRPLAQEHERRGRSMSHARSGQ